MMDVVALTPIAKPGETGALIRTAAALCTLTGLLLIAPVSVYAQGYGGPSLLSRGGNAPGKRGRAPMAFTPYAAVRGLYETGLIAPLLTEDGGLSSQSLNGGQVEVGAYGAKNWRRSSIGLDYRGDYRRTNIKRFNGTNQALSLDWQAQVTPRISYFLRQTGGTTNRAFGAFSAPAFVDQDNFGVPLNEVFDSRVYFAQSSGGVSYRQTARLTYRLSGDGFIVKRSSRALIGMQGYRAGAELHRQMSRSTMLGVGYNYMRFEYPRVYGGSEIHLAFGSIDRRIGRNLSVGGQLGIFHADTTGTQQITLSPEVAAVLGRTSGVEAFQRITTSPQGMLKVNYSMERSQLYVSFNSGITPGNGVYITSRADSVRGGYSYSGLRRLSLGASAGYTRTNSIGLELRDFTSYQGGGGLTYKLGEFLSLSLQADRRVFSSPAIIGRSGASVSAGLSFAPGQMPLSIW